MHNKDLYRELCKTEPTIPIFSKEWWLDAVCGEDNWGAVVIEKSGNIVGALPYYMIRKKGFNRITMPPLTQTMGPWIKYPPNQKYTNRLSHEKDIYTEIISRLPDFGDFQQNFNYRVTNWLPFFWQGFQATTRYTYVIENLDDLDEVLLRFKDNMRNKIKKARKIVSVVDEGKIEDFYAINRKTFERQGLDIPYSLDFLIKKDRILAKKNCRRIFFAVDQDGCIHSALYLIWDELSSYVHMVGEDPVLRNSGAGILLIYESIKFTKETLNLDCYDFEGSVIESVEEVRRSCGGVQKPYFSVSKVNSRYLKFRQHFVNCIRAVVNK